MGMDAFGAYHSSRTAKRVGDTNALLTHLGELMQAQLAAQQMTNRLLRDLAQQLQSGRAFEWGTPQQSKGEQ